MTLIKKTNHVLEAVGNFVEQFKGKSKLAAYLTTFIEQVQDLEDAFFQVLEERGVETSTGVQLDGLGEVIGEEREGRTDGIYRQAIKGRIVLNVDDSSTEDVIRLISVIASDKKAHLVEYYPAGFTITIDAPVYLSNFDPVQAGKTLQSGKPAGVKAQLIYYPWGVKKFDSPDFGFDKGKFGGAIE